MESSPLVHMPWHHSTALALHIDPQYVQQLQQRGIQRGTARWRVWLGFPGLRLALDTQARQTGQVLHLRWQLIRAPRDARFSLTLEAEEHRAISPRRSSSDPEGGFLFYRRSRYHQVILETPVQDLHPQGRLSWLIPQDLPPSFEIGSLFGPAEGGVAWSIRASLHNQRKRMAQVALPLLLLPGSSWGTYRPQGRDLSRIPPLEEQPNPDLALTWNGPELEPGDTLRGHLQGSSIATGGLVTLRVLWQWRAEERTFTYLVGKQEARLFPGGAWNFAFPLPPAPWSFQSSWQRIKWFLEVLDGSERVLLRRAFWLFPASRNRSPWLENEK